VKDTASDRGDVAHKAPVRRLINCAAVADVFVSYVEADRPTAERVGLCLLAAGWSVSWDRPDPTALSHNDQRELASAACVVALLSRKSVSLPAFQEQVIAAEYRNTLLPLQIEDVVPPSMLRAKHITDLTAWSGHPNDLRFQGLLATIRIYVDRRPVHRSRKVASRKQNAFICYRRGDAADAAGRLYDHLSAVYGSSRVCMDIESVPLGIDYVEHVGQQIGQSSVVIVMIGNQWLTINDKKRRRRLDSEDDLVRAEIRAALQQSIPVIPVVVQNAEMPVADDLPEDIRPLARRNGIELSATRWSANVERLLKELDKWMKP
jgi:TIR domain